MYECIMLCLDFFGEIKDSLSVFFGEYLIDFFVIYEFYFCDWKDRIINKQNLNLINRDIDVVLKLEEWMLCVICVLKFGDLLVCMIVYYNDQCKII